MAALKDDLPTAMIAAAFAGISWYIGVELNVRLYMSRLRRSGLYFASVLLCSWGVLSQPVLILLVNFGIWKPSPGSITAIYLSWWILVVPQSFVLYSRLHLFIPDARLRWILYLIVFNAIVFSIPTVVVGVLAQSVLASKLTKPNLALDKAQLAVFFTQETFLSLLYIRETRVHLKRVAPLHDNESAHRRVMHHLILINIFIICLDISLIGVCYSSLFYVQGHYKPCVYAIKLRLEFTILNDLRTTLQASLESARA
ncbi:hypothetical protein DM02DRAFT_639173 [Periconia macrospinosa]|uniref:DUF7703 domain-containing protein n=1 Tax=Periconia macrospinosa TaxID=97972 RepID=A0A2V1E614_9PLEO|nr:hypothetical protein DM02DRAFT_639173 [Periconia macrospinosa]